MTVRVTHTTQPVTLDRVRSVRRRIHAYLAQEMRELGADPTVLHRQASRLV